MKKHLFAVAAAAALGSPAALAQGMTIAGVADAAVRSVSNEGRGSVKSLISGGNATSRLIVRGSEDLGGGLSASFHLEHGIALDTGTPASATQFWDRRSTLSLASKSLGEVRAGRDFVPSYSNWGRFDPFSYVGVASSSNFVSATPLGPIRSAFSTNPNTTVRSSNAVQLLLPRGLGGLEGGAMVAAGEGGTAANGQHKVIGVRLGYGAGPVAVSVARTTSENNLTTTGKFEDTALAGAYDLGAIRLSAAWRQFKQASSKQTNLLLGAIVPVGTGEVKVSWNRVDLSGSVGATVVDANDASQIGLGYVYNLSKRTALYATAARIGNKGAAAYAIAGGPSGLVGGGSSTGYEAGVRHAF